MDGTPAKAIFYVLTFLSIGVMFWQIFGRAKYWMKGQKLTWKPHYVKGILTYVLGQRKVMGSRPRSGAPMHLFIFYGFLGLLLATTLLALASYAPLLGLENWHRGNYYLAYEAIFDTFGILFLVGVSWAFVRRYRLSKQLGEPTPDPQSGKLARSSNPITTEWKDFAVLALLFILGFGGFLLEAARIAADPKPWDHFSYVGFAMAQFLPRLSPEGYKAIWWGHMVFVWVFFMALPQMRLKHILVATLTASGTGEHPMGRLPNSGGEVAGAAFATDYSRWHLMSLDACMSCGRCTEVCPAYGSGKELNPKQVVQDIHRALTTSKPVAEVVTEEALWQCTTCNACVEACPVLIRHVDLIVDARRNLVGEGKLSGTTTVMLRQVGATQSAWGQDSHAREDWMSGLGIPLCRNKVEFDYLFWVGCAGATDPGAVKTTKAFAKLLQKAGVKFACLGKEEACTGDAARRVGDEATFDHQLQSNQTVFERYGVKKIVTCCPHCLNTFRNEYGIDDRVEVLHHTELLDQLVQQGKLKRATPQAGSLTYHDPCYLARVNNISDAPRRLVGENARLDSNTPLMLQAKQANSDVLAEPIHKGKKTLCCGAGGGRMWMEEEPDKRPSTKRTEELLATGAKTVAVSCPFCRIMLDASIKQISEDDIKLVDMAEVLQEANQ